jgi:hypothetical protein
MRDLPILSQEKSLITSGDLWIASAGIAPAPEIQLLTTLRSRLYLAVKVLKRPLGPMSS